MGQPLVGTVDDGVHILIRDVALHDPHEAAVGTRVGMEEGGHGYYGY
jgi:hypothetical protein